MEKILPNFICVGAQKAGTSTLFDILKQSNEVYFPKDKKELHFFEKDENFNRGIDFYASFFEKGYSGEKNIGEITPEYLFYAYVPNRIKELLGPIKIIILLRNPIVRSYSQFNFHKMYQVESLQANFLEEIEKERIAKNVDHYQNWCEPKYYLSKSMYYNQVNRYIEVFGKENVQVCLFEELFGGTKTDLTSVQDFLSISEFKFERVHSNKSVVNKNNKVFNVLSSLKRLTDTIVPNSITRSLAKSLKSSLKRAPEKLSKEQIVDLNKKYFISDINNLEKLLNRDLSIWYS